MDPFTCADLKARRLEDLRKEREDQIDAYVKAIYSAVLDEAKYGHETFVTFWIVRSTEAHFFIRHAVGLCYPWKRRHIASSMNASVNTLLQRPIPADLLDDIWTRLTPLFPDLTVRTIRPALVVNGFAQDFLEVRWTLS
jgi:hypothetical protein